MPYLIAMLNGALAGLALRKRKRNRRAKRQTGLLTEAVRPALSPETRTEMLKSLMFSWPHPHNSPRTLDFTQLELAQARIYAPARIVMAFLDWRGISEDITSWTAMKAMDALIRKVIKETMPTCHYEEASIPDGMAPLNDDEIRSISKMWMIYLHVNDLSLTKELIAQICQDVEDNKALLDYASALLKRVERDRLQKEASQKSAAARRERLERHPPEDRLKDGWFPFLATLDEPDIYLWHQIATDFDELGGDRLNAAYWVLEQPECDRATAWTFVVEAILSELLVSELREDARHPDLPVSRRSLFEGVLRRWSEGFYRFHSIGLEEAPPSNLIGLQAAADRLTALAEQPQIILPAGFTTNLGPPQHDTSRSKGSGYFFISDQGLMRVEDA